jgi:hypothetical protein
LEIEVSKRSKEINRIICNYFDGNTTKLLYFFTGYHYRDFYTDYLDRKNKLIEEREEKLRQLTQEKSDIIEDYEDKIRELDRDYPLFIMGEITLCYIFMWHFCFKHNQIPHILCHSQCILIIIE